MHANHARKLVIGLALFGASVVSIGWSTLAAGETAQPPVESIRLRLVSPEKEALLRRCLPRVADPAMQQVLDDPNLILYTEAEMPKAYQFLGGAHHGVHSVDYNISANSGEPFGNGNLEFPWGTPAGTHRSPNVSAFRFLSLPTDDQGKTLPVVWYQGQLSGDGAQGYAWRFPVGTIFGEVLMLRGPDDRDYTFELRLRLRHTGNWGADVFRPFPEAVNLADRIKQLRPNWAELPQVAALVRHLESPVALPARVLADGHPRPSFEQLAGVDMLPDVGDDQLVRELLMDTTFQSAEGVSWRMGTNDLSAAAPTTEAGFHIVPAKYDAGFIDVDAASCLRCHATVNQNVDRFQQGRDWYGRIRGSDGIFSFHPFDLASISTNGFPNTVRMRDELIEAGILEQFDPARHPNSIYHDVPDLVE